MIQTGFSGVRREWDREDRMARREMTIRKRSWWKREMRISKQWWLIGGAFSLKNAMVREEENGSVVVEVKR